MNNHHFENFTTQISSSNNHNDCIIRSKDIKKLTLSDLSSNSSASFFSKPKYKQDKQEKSKRFSEIYTYRDMYEYKKRLPDSNQNCSFENSDFVFDCNSTLKKRMSKKKSSYSLVDDYENRLIAPIYYLNNTIHSNRSNCCCHCTCCHANTNKNMMLPYNNNNNVFFMQTDGTLALSAIPIQKPITRMISRHHLVEPITPRKQAFISNVPIPMKPKVIDIKNKTQYYTADSRGSNSVNQRIHDEYFRRTSSTLSTLQNEKLKRKSKLEYEDQLNRDLKILEEYDKIEVPLFASTKEKEDSKVKSKSNYYEKSEAFLIRKANLAQQEDISINPKLKSSENYERSASANKVSGILKYNDSMTSLDDFVRSPHNYYKNQNLDRKLYNSDYSTDSVSVGSIDQKPMNFNINKENYKDILSTSHVKEAPSFILMPKSFVGKITENAKFKCKFNGFPQPTVTWFINNVNLKTLDMPHKYKLYSKKNGAHYLKIFNLKSYDCGRIMCSIQNSMGTSEACANLTVLSDQGDDLFK